MLCVFIILHYINFATKTNKTKGSPVSCADPGRRRGPGADDVGRHDGRPRDDIVLLRAYVTTWWTIARWSTNSNCYYQQDIPVKVTTYYNLDKA